ncbi:unnamed protein product [Rangifer tarandus platyrhynchus]|uniref:Uncharacterized protein n=1 Tax=Rangifer tarandus platyrhynchus TaxID=3082113 RepID=A0AC59Z1P5_RANTA
MTKLKQQSTSVRARGIDQPSKELAGLRAAGPAALLTGKVNLEASVWHRLLRKRWVLALVFGLSLVYFLSSTFKQEEQ